MGGGRGYSSSPVPLHTHIHYLPNPYLSKYLKKTIKRCCSIHYCPVEISCLISGSKPTGPGYGSVSRSTKKNYADPDPGPDMPADFTAGFLSSPVLYLQLSTPNSGKYYIRHKHEPELFNIFWEDFFSFV